MRCKGLRLQELFRAHCFRPSLGIGINLAVQARRAAAQSRGRGSGWSEGSGRREGKATAEKAAAAQQKEAAAPPMPWLNGEYVMPCGSEGPSFTETQPEAKPVPQLALVGDHLSLMEQMRRVISCWALAEKRATHLCAFETLGLSFRCRKPSQEEVKKAWRLLCVRLHPDRNVDCTELATNATRCLNLAKDYLFDVHFGCGCHSSNGSGSCRCGSFRHSHPSQPARPQGCGSARGVQARAREGEGGRGGGGEGEGGQRGSGSGGGRGGGSASRAARRGAASAAGAGARVAATSVHSRGQAASGRNGDGHDGAAGKAASDIRLKSIVRRGAPRGARPIEG